MDRVNGFLFAVLRAISESRESLSHANSVCKHRLRSNSKLNFSFSCTFQKKRSCY